MNRNAWKFLLICISALICFTLLGLNPETVYLQGHDSQTVFQIQKKLQALGYAPGPLDGIWGKQTQGALRRFQNDNGLSVTGKLDHMTQRELGLFSFNRDVSKGKINVLSIQGRIREALEPKWEIEKIQIEKDKLTIVPNFEFINKQRYASMIQEICKYADVSDQLTQIWILNVGQNQGWVLLNPKKCCKSEVGENELNMNRLIFRYSSDVFIFKSK